MTMRAFSCRPRSSTDCARAGSEYVSSQPYVVAGKRSALCHATFERQRVKKRDVVFFEVGGCYYRYGGAIMRSVAVGKPTLKLQNAADAVLGALDAVLNAVRPGVTSGEVDAAGRNVVKKAGLGQYWLHRTGYSIGIGFSARLGRRPRHRPEAERPAAAGGGDDLPHHTVPMLLVPDIGAVGFSETWTVTKTGVRVLTDTPRKLHIR